MPSHSKKRSERGGIEMEFVLVSSMFLVPLILGVFSLGFELMRASQTIQLSRDVGHMWALGMNFANQPNQDLVINRLADGMGMQGNPGNSTGGTTGNGVVVVSAFTKIPATCKACTNAGHIVVMRRIVIGNKTLFTTVFGAPAVIDATTGDVTNYANDTTTRADNLGTVIAMNDGDLCYMAESYFKGMGISIPDVSTSAGSYARAIF